MHQHSRIKTVRRPQKFAKKNRLFSTSRYLFSDALGLSRFVLPTNLVLVKAVCLCLYSCGECPAGYQGNGETCLFLGPCHINNGGCSPLAMCMPFSGTVQCYCRPGYQGIGVGPMGCTPGTAGPGAGGPPLPGPVVDTGGGVVISPCASGPCRNGATCIPSAMAYSCLCSEGYTGSLRHLKDQ